ncbi:MAG: hypothetical protein AAGC85_15810 [Bacteroidota bacterium]
MTEETDFEPLSNIQKVDAPPFLFTRIEASINALQEEAYPIKWVRLALAGFVVLMLLNIWLVGQNVSGGSSVGEDNMAVLSAGVELYQSNQLYNE